MQRTYPGHFSLGPYVCRLLVLDVDLCLSRTPASLDQYNWVFLVQVVSSFLQLFSILVYAALLELEMTKISVHHQFL